MDIERLIVSKVAQSGRIERLVSAGYDEYHFHQDDCRNVWKFSVDYLQKYHSAPSFDSVKHEFPAFEFELSTEPLEALSDKFLKVIKKREAVQGIRDIAAAVDDPNLVNQIDDLFLEKARHVSQRIPSESRVVRFSEMPTRIDDYKRSAEEGLQRGLTTGIPQFDEVTLGIQPHEFVSIVGWQGRGKSTLLQLCFFHQYLEGATPMLISLEMEAEALYRKWDTMAVNFEYRALKALELGIGDLQKWETWGERAADAKNDIIVIDDLGRCSVETIYAETVKYNPDVVGVDYISLMDAPRSVGALWEKVTYITQGLKRNARSLSIPVVGVAQTNINSATEGARLENIAYSRSIGQDSDIVFGLEQSDDQKELGQMEVNMIKNRDGAISSAKLNWDMSHMEFSDWNNSNLFKRGRREIANEEGHSP